MTADSFYSLKTKTLQGQPADLSPYRGKVTLVVNVASQCGFTPQYAGLEKLHDELKGRGFSVLGFPSNDFGAQEPGSNAEIKTFCTRKYNVQFPMMSKVSVKGSDTTPLYQYLTSASLHPKTGGEIKWNFTKFLFDRKGDILARFEPEVTPDSPEVVAAIEKAVGQ